MNSSQILPETRRLLPLLSVGATVLLAAGCGHRPIVVQAPPATVIQAPASQPAVVHDVMPAPAPTPTGQPAVIVVNQPPPAPLQDTQAPQPSQQHVWIPGYWAWRANQQQWIAGHWEIPPRPSATWVPSRWERRGSEYVFVDGYWQ